MWALKLFYPLWFPSLLRHKMGPKWPKIISLYIYIYMYICMYISIPEFRAPLLEPCQEVTVYLETYIYASTRDQLF